VEDQRFAWGIFLRDGLPIPTTNPATSLCALYEAALKQSAKGVTREMAESPKA